MVNIVTWFWGTKYPIEYLQKLAAGLKRHMGVDYRFSVFTDRGFFSVPHVHDVFYIPESSFDLLGCGCFIRLQMFNPAWQQKYGFAGKIVNIDIDSVITDNLAPLWARDEPFVILQGANTANPCPFNGALFMIEAGAYPEVWEDFSLERAQIIPKYEFPDDQGWIHYKLPSAVGWKVGVDSGVYVYQKNGWPAGTDLPFAAKIVTFVGTKAPHKLRHLDWIKEHWV